MRAVVSLVLYYHTAAAAAAADDDGLGKITMLKNAKNHNFDSASA